MKKGINQWCFRLSFSTGEIFDLAQKAGFQGVELVLGKDGEVAYNGEDPKALAGLADQARRRDLELFSLSTGLHWVYPLSSSDPEVRAEGIRIGLFMIRAARALGADSVLIVPGVADPDVPYRDVYRIAQESLYTLSQSASEYDVKIGVENVWNRFLQSPLETLSFIEEVGSPYDGAYFDVGNALYTGYPQHWIELLSEHIVKVHVKDFSTDIGGIRGFTYLLPGDVPWASVMKKLREVGYDDFLTPELTPPKSFNTKLVHEISESLNAIMEKGL